MAVLSQSVGKKLIEILGLPMETKSVSLRFAVDEAVTAEVVYLLNEEQCEKLLEVVALYKLTEIGVTGEVIEDED